MILDLTTDSINEIYLECLVTPKKANKGYYTQTFNTTNEDFEIVNKYCRKNKVNKGLVFAHLIAEFIRGVDLYDIKPTVAVKPPRVQKFRNQRVAKYNKVQAFHLYEDEYLQLNAFVDRLNLNKSAMLRNIQTQYIKTVINPTQESNENNSIA